MSLFPPSPLPPDSATFTVREVAKLALCTIRTVRHYIRQQVVPAPAFRSSKTRYDRAFLVRLRAARTLRQRGLHVGGLRAELAAMPQEEMIRLAGFVAPDEAEVTAHDPAGPEKGGQAQVGAAPAAPGTGTLPAGFVGPYRAGAAPPHERWDFFEVCPGVKLMVCADADPEARRVANEMLALFGPRG